MARILLIDDDEPTRTALRTMLELAGHNVQEKIQNQTSSLWTC